MANTQKKPLNPILSGSVSKIENSFIDELAKLIPDRKISRQFKITRKKSGYYFYDLMLDNKFIIEFNGNFWHANPTIYDKNWSNPISNQSYSEIHQNDTDKKILAESLGYSYIVIWEKDYTDNPEKCLNEILNKIP